MMIDTDRIEDARITAELEEGDVPPDSCMGALREGQAADTRTTCFNVQKERKRT